MEQLRPLLPPTPPYVLSYSLSHMAVLDLPLYNQPVNMRVLLSAGCHSSKPSNRKKGHGDPVLGAAPSEARRVPGACSWCLEGQPWGPEPSPVGPQQWLFLSFCWPPC